jgi:hypothetical protein
MRELFLRELDKWSFPVTDWELATVKEILRLPVISVHRAPAAQLEWMRMKPRECHVNARFMEENDPEKRTKRVIGWWQQDGNYVLHSIVRSRGKYMCVTPVHEGMNASSPFPFIRDPKIEVRVEEGRNSYYRNGVQIGPGVRRDPARTLADIEVVRERLLSGMDPYEALIIPSPSPHSR